MESGNSYVPQFFIVVLGREARLGGGVEHAATQQTARLGWEGGAECNLRGLLETANA